MSSTFISTVVAFTVINLPTSAADLSIPPLPQAVSSFGACTCEGYVYVYGGHTGRTHTYSTETTSGKFHRLKLSAPEQGWEELPGGPHLQGLALVAHERQIYRIGGMRPRNMPGESADNHSTASFARYDPAANRWEQLPDLPAPRSSHDAVVVGNKLVIVGGWQIAGEAAPPIWHDTALILDLSDPTKSNWKVVTQPFQRRALTAATLRDKVYVVAGLTPDGKTDHSVNVFDPETEKWDTTIPIPGDRMNAFTPAACVLDGTMYLSPADGVVYRLTDAKWEPSAKLAHLRFVHRLVPSGNGRMLVIGGASKTGNVSAVEVITLTVPAAAK
jgi:N-acetylneuraminic acid mutarotase